MLNEDGQLHNAPFTCINGNGYGHSYSKMENGRAAKDSYLTYFRPDGFEQYLDSKQNKALVSGW